MLFRSVLKAAETCRRCCADLAGIGRNRMVFGLCVAGYRTGRKGLVLRRAAPPQPQKGHVMSYETDYQYRQQADRNVGRRGQHPMDLPHDGSSKGLLIFAAIIIAFIAFVVFVSVGSPPDGASQTAPDAGSSSEAAPSVAPTQGE